MATATKRAAAAAGDEKGPAKEVVTISPPRIRTVTFTLVGTSPYMQCAFSQKAIEAMRENKAQGSTAKKGKKREAADFAADFENAKHRSTDGWYGIPAGAFRAACIDVCRMVNYQMTRAKMSIFIVADGLDRVDSTQLVRLVAGEPEQNERPVRLPNGSWDIRVRPLWKEWSVKLRVQFDEDQFKLSDVANLLARAGMQVGVGEGRPFSKESNGLGYGLFAIAEGVQE